MYRWRYIWLFSRSEGAGSATTRKTRGLTRSVIALMVPPFPAASRPSKMTMTRSPFALTHSWRMQSFACSLCSSFSNFRCLSFDIASLALRLPAATQRPVELRPRAQLGAARLRQQQLLCEQLLIGRQDLDVAGETRIVPGAGQIGRVLQHRDPGLALSAHFVELLNRDQRVGDLAVAVERGLLVLGERHGKGRLRRLEIAADASGLKDRLEQPRRQRPHRSVAAEEFREIAADAAEKPGEADGRKEQRLRRADIGIRRDQQLFRLEDVRPPLEERSGQPGRDPRRKLRARIQGRS